jgi:peptidyl-prolyl cis-trans isomerase SurA
MPAWAGQSLDRIVAVVNKDVILQSELHKAVVQTRESLQAQGRPAPSADKLRHQVLHSLVMQHLQLQVANRMNITVSQKELDRALDSIATQNHMNKRQFSQAVQAEGLSYADFREHVRKQLKIDKLRNKEMAKHISVSDREIDLYLANQKARGNTNEAYHLSQILITVPENASPKQIQAARHKAKGLLEQIHGGASFSQLAIDHSDGQQALNGGDLGWMQAKALPTVFASVVPTLKVGQVSHTLRRPSGFHLVKMDDKRGTAAKMVAEYHVRNLLLKPSEVRNATQTRKQLEKIDQRLQEGAKFSKLAHIYSDDSASSHQGGNLGWKTADELAPALATHVKHLEPGQISKPFKTSRGWQIIQLVGKRQRNHTQELRRRQAREQIRRRKIGEQYQNYLRRLRDRAYIKYRLRPVSKTQSHIPS